MLLYFNEQQLLKSFLNGIKYDYAAFERKTTKKISFQLLFTGWLKNVATLVTVKKEYLSCFLFHLCS